MTSELEQAKDPDDAEELEHICILDVGHMLLEEEVGIEADGRNIVYYIY